MTTEQDIQRLARALGLWPSRKSKDELLVAIDRAVRSAAPVPRMPKLAPRVLARWRNRRAT